MKDKIIELLKKGPHTFTFIKEQINFYNSRKLDLLLRELIQEDKIYFKFKTKEYLIKDQEFVTGIFKETKKDYGFVDLENNTSIFIPAKFTQSSFHGDLVKVLLFPLSKDDDPEKRAGRVSRILQRNVNNLIGKIITKNNTLTFEAPDIPHEHNYIFTNLQEFENKIHINDLVVVNFINLEKGNAYLKIKRILGSLENSKLDFKQLLIKNNLSEKFSDEVEKEVSNITSNIKENSNRKKIQNSLIVTIDGESSKDLDDAIETRVLKNNNFLLRVHIADVSYYVKENSMLDQEALKRGTSIYLINKVIPMLPKKLSNDLCSLNPNEDKNTLTFEAEIDQKGNFVKYDVYESLIKSNYRLTYKEVDEFLNLYRNNSKEIFKNDLELTKMILNSQKLSQILRNKKLQNNMIDFKLPEVVVSLDEKDFPTQISLKYQTESEGLIEDLMVAANEGVAKILIENNLPGIFRVHPKPEYENIEKFINIASIFGEFLNKKPEALQGSDFEKLIENIENKEYSLVLKKYLVQSMEKAIYWNKNRGHYALGLKNYLHFTSPIRRYPDLIVHRVIRNYLLSKNKINKDNFNDLESVAKYLSEKERESTMIERKLVDIKKTRFYKKLIGNIMEGRIVSVTNFGFFINLKYETQGLIKIEDMTDDEYYHDAKKFSIIGKKKKRSFKLGDKLKVKIVDINVLKGIVELKII